MSPIVSQSNAAKEFATDLNGQPITVAEKYNQLRQKIVELYGKRVWFLTDAALSVHISCLLEDSTNPLALVLVDGPSTEKTTVLDFFEGLPSNYRIDKFTPASFLTQSPAVTGKNLKKVDLLPKLVYKTMMIPEMAPTFNQPREQLMESFALLARILDGNGLVTAGGVHGERKLTGDYLFSILGATTPLPQTAWNTMGKVGSRLIFLNAPARMNRKERRARALDIMTGKVHYKTKKKLAKEAVAEFLGFLFSQHESNEYSVPEDAPEDLQCIASLRDHCGYLPRSIVWDKSNDNHEVMEKMALMAEFLTAGRADVQVWTERTEDGHQDTTSSGAVTEGVDRFTSIIYNLARCHAILTGRTGIGEGELPLIVAIVISSLPDTRRKAIELLVGEAPKHKQSKLGTFTVGELATSMSCSDKPAKLTMEKLKITGLGKIENGCGTSQTTFTLREDYEWLLSDEFRRLYRQWDAPTEGTQEPILF